MKQCRFIPLTLAIIVGFCVPAFSQIEIVERLPKDAYVVNWEPVFRNIIASYVQLPGDSLEYRKVKIYVLYKPRANRVHEEEPYKYNDLTRLRYLGAVLIRTGRKFTKILDNSVLGVENFHLTTEDQLLNNEMVSAR
ncbi:hypothetical protein MUK70_21175 [Dyadobacter chenwenxiniae]|uniref:Uncharacterized protein n=1 Tax=Dyadobacter chenwenxiniae TaxID=2906456 RepID=A0A9X1PJ93_9BACT|nr:hypothetical protein [Dyadobacter chenwenxiniae]MCF0061756.1 hypothetical protein [Dyadobacter chenwenxiniae]UON81573.1 hypothetical protein MUK70_21175 [Dyadobacter chenwenxiniae]